MTTNHTNHKADPLAGENVQGTCGQCRARFSDGRCHRFPPTLQHPNKDLSAWPVVAEEAAGCLEFRPAKILETEAAIAVAKNLADRAAARGEIAHAEKPSRRRAL